MSTEQRLRALIYCRVSSQGQLDNTSLASQMERCRAFCVSRGWQIVEEFDEGAASGRKEDRAQLEALLERVRRGGIDVVVVFKLDRFTRSSRHLHNWLEELRQNKAALASASEGIDTSSATGELIASVVGAVAQMERTSIAERMQTGLQARVRAGGWSGGNQPPYGYRIVGEGRDAHLEVDRGEQHLVETAVSLLLDRGFSTLQAAQQLNVLGLTPRNAPLWTSQNLRNMLRRGQFDGVWTFAKPAKRVTVYEPITIQVPPVLPPERVAAVRTYLDATTLVRSSGQTHPLSGRLFCRCGSHMTGIARGDRAHRRYRCRYGRHEPGRPFCDEPSLRAERVDDAVWAQVVALLAKPELLHAAAEQRLARLSPPDDGRTLADARRRMDKARSALAGAAAKCLAAGLDDETTQQTISSLKATYEAAVQQEQHLAAQVLRAQVAVDRAAAVSRLAEVARERLEDADRDLRAKVLALLDVQVTVTASGKRKGDSVTLDVTGSVAHDQLLRSSTDWHLPGGADDAE